MAWLPPGTWKVVLAILAAFLFGVAMGRGRGFALRSSRSGLVARTASLEHEETKMMVCLRTDLAMGKGKLVAQAGHAVLGAYERLLKTDEGKAALQLWRSQGQRKIAVKVQSLAELEGIENAARRQGLNAYAIHDAGRTQVESGTCTALAIGPGRESVLDAITGDLKLL